jgi:hypothetical protein
MDCFTNICGLFNKLDQLEFATGYRRKELTQSDYLKAKCIEDVRANTLFLTKISERLESLNNEAEEILNTCIRTLDNPMISVDVKIIPYNLPIDVLPVVGEARIDLCYLIGFVALKINFIAGDCLKITSHLP